MDPLRTARANSLQRDRTSVTGTGTTVTPGHVRDARRWLRFGPRRTPAPPSAITTAFQSTDGPELSRILTHAVEAAVDVGAMKRTDAHAWLTACGLTTTNQTLDEIARTWGLTSTRGAAKRLARLDAVVAAHIQTGPSTNNHQVASGLVALAAELTIQGHVDAADGTLQAAATLAEEPHRPHLIGKQRVRRLRARRSALAAGPTTATPPPHQPTTILVCHHELHQDPSAAVASLKAAWKSGDTATLPLLMQQALLAVPSTHAAGISTRLELLETISNITRDAEILEGVYWTTLWLKEASRDITSSTTSLQTIKARRTRAHLLQLHGFTSTARKELERAWHELHILHHRHPEFAIERPHLLNRLLIAKLAEGKLTEVRETLRHHDTTTPEFLRLRTHLASLLSEQQRREHRRPTRSPETSALLDKGFAELTTTTGSQYHALIDTLIAAATRIGDQAAIDEALTRLRPIDPIWANLHVRIHSRLRLAHKHLPRSGADPLAIGAAPPHPLRSAGRPATDSRFSL